MKLLWVKTDFLHPTTRGGQIRTLEILRRLHQRHEVHYVAFHDPSQPEGLARSHEYCTHAYPIEHHVPVKRSLAFAGQLVGGLFRSLPVAVSRYTSKSMQGKITELVAAHGFDRIICDFIFPAPNLGGALRRALLFQHNVESTIWFRHQEHARTPLHRWYFASQARRMLDCERSFCTRASHVLAVSETDAQTMRQRFGLREISIVPTGVDIEYFRRPARAEGRFDIVFVGSMDWMPNHDAVSYFFDAILPAIRRRVPACTVGVVGRTPPPSMIELARRDPRVTVTGTVPDVRPYLWGAALSIVPLRIGGGTRLKIYESMAAGTPVVSTTIGAEGLEVSDRENIRLADTDQDLAAACVELIQNQGERDRLARAGQALVSARFSWDAAVDRFEQILRDRGADQRS